jgi:hypothetical protein
MTKLKAYFANLLRAVANKIDPPPMVVQGGGGHGEE